MMADQAQSSSFKDSPAAAAVAFAKIAKGLRKLGEVSLALDVCDKGINRFPDNSNLYVIKGETLISSYNQKNRPESLKAALSSLEKALKLDPQNYLARLLSSQIYLKAGAIKRARAYLENVLDTSPDDERAIALMEVVKNKEAKAERKKAEAQARKETPTEETEPAGGPVSEGDEYDEPGEVVISDSLVAGGESGGAGEEQAGGSAATTRGDTSQWVLDDKVVIGDREEAEDEHIQEVMSAKLTIFSRLEGLIAIFLLDKDGLPIKIINRAKVNENVIPSFVYNLYKVSMNGVRRTGFGSFQRGTLVCPIGTIILANAFYATIAVIVDNDASLSSVEKRIQRYLEEVTG